jgi:hypothetical protein
VQKYTFLNILETFGKSIYHSGNVLWSEDSQIPHLLGECAGVHEGSHGNGDTAGIKRKVIDGEP